MVMVVSALALAGEDVLFDEAKCPCEMSDDTAGEQSSAATSDFPTAVGPARTITRGRYFCFSFGSGSSLLSFVCCLSVDVSVVVVIILFLPTDKAVGGGVAMEGMGRFLDDIPNNNDFGDRERNVLPVILILADNDLPVVWIMNLLPMRSIGFSLQIVVRLCRCCCCCCFCKLLMNDNDVQY